MSAMVVACFAFVCIFGGALLGQVIRALLPHHHLCPESKEVVKLGAGLIATLAALVLGLLVSSAKGTMDAMTAGLTMDGAKVILLDRVLEGYGPETRAIREGLRSNVRTVIEQIWVKKQTDAVRLRRIEASRGTEQLQSALRLLSPRNDTQRELKLQAQRIAAELAESRWVLVEQAQQTLPLPFLVVLLFWLAILFAGFGLLSPGNSTVIVVLLICAVSVSGAIFMILEMNTPLEGLVKISDAPLQKALDHLGSR